MTVIDGRKLRDGSLAAAANLGFPTNPDLPLTESETALRPLDEIVDRVLVLSAMIGATLRFGTERARAYLAQENLLHVISPGEQAYLDGDDSEEQFIGGHVEGINALLWALGFVQKIPFDQECSDELVYLLPDMKSSAPSAPFREAASLRPLAEVLAADDLAYCLHWALRESQLSGRPLPGKVRPYVIVERRRALDWMLSNEDWDDLALDT